MISFQSVTVEFIRSLNAERLLSLELWNCQYHSNVLGRFGDIYRDAGEIQITNPVVGLKKLTVVVDKEAIIHQEGLEAQNYYQYGLYNFLLTFEGLESVQLRLWKTTRWNIVATGLLNHRDTLKYVVLHSEGREEEEGTDTEFSHGIPWSAEIGDLCEIPSLIGLGISMHPWVFVSILTLSLPSFLPKLT